MIHTREADEACGRILEDEIAKGPFKAVLHCYTGGRELAMKAIGLGLSISFTGILTFKNSQAIRDIAAELPADRIMVETDAPYLAPGKFRGKRNEPSFVAETARVLAETRCVSIDEIAQQTTENFFRLFDKVPRPDAAAAMTVILTILGSGSSAGVPRPALGWGRMRSEQPKNRRRRCSLLAEKGGANGLTRVLIDTSPDLREQLIDANVDHLEATFLTHEHADRPMASTICVRCPASAQADSGLSEQVHRQGYPFAFLLLLRAGPRQRLSGDPGKAINRGG